MGHWKITIEGVGPNLNGGIDDADDAAKSIVMALKERGHNVTRAEFSGSGKPPMDVNVDLVHDQVAVKDVAEASTGTDDVPQTPAPQ